jgi:AraC family transcriptional regulator
MPGKKIELKRSTAGPICDIGRTIRSIGPTNILEADKCSWRNRIQAGGQVGTIWMSNVAQARVEVSPGDAAKRLSASWDGVSAETAQFVGGGPFDYRFCAPVHLLTACERAVRSAGETSVGRSLKSSRHDVGGTLSLVPAGDELCGTFVPRVCPRTTYIYLSPKTPVEDGDIDFTKVGLTPRLFFENAALWATATKLSGLVENSGTASRLYAETLAKVLLLELLRFEQGSAAMPQAARGGLAAWQVRRAREFIEEHVAEQISLAELARLTRLSPIHFCRAFKRSVGLPPHQYQLRRRIERAKTLLADPRHSVTSIALECGFSLPGSFSTAFHRATGMTPSAFRRALR